MALIPKKDTEEDVHLRTLKVLHLKLLFLPEVKLNKQLQVEVKYSVNITRPSGVARITDRRKHLHPKVFNSLYLFGFIFTFYTLHRRKRKK